MPNGAIFASTHTANLDLPSLPMTARQAHILHVLARHSLLSLGKMCESGCVITFIANKVAVKHSAATISTGTHDKDSGLLRVPLGEPTIDPPPSTRRTMSLKKVYPRHNCLFTCMFQPCARHLDQSHWKWALCNMAIIGGRQCPYVPPTIFCNAQRLYESATYQINTNYSDRANAGT
jgi:hypothetical protein